MKASRIVLPEAPEYTQMNLFGATGVTAPGNLNPFPDILRDDYGFYQVLEAATSTIGLGLDFEFNSKTEKPSILGIAVPNLAAAIPWRPEQAKRTVEWCLKHGIPIVGHSVVGADKPVLEKALDIKTPLSIWEDTMLKHYLLHQDFCKGTDKEDDEGSLGFMNLWVMASMTTNASQWKICRGRACDGPCPRHNVFEYCAVDAWAGIAGNIVMDRQMREMGVPYQFYRELMELSEICDKMERQGVRINLPYIEKLDKEMEDAKDKIFEYEELNGARFYKHFNPKSPDQIIDWFKTNGITLKTTDIKYVQKILEKQGQKNEHGDFKEYCDYLDDYNESDVVSDAERQLYNLYRFKKSGKGTDAWFGDKYRILDFIHPRFIVPGTSTGRLSSSRPNFQNIPVRGWAVVKNPDGSENHRIKAAIIPRDESLDFLESDASQLELRVCLYLSGVDPSEAGADAFKWLVEQGYQDFKKAASIWPGLDPEDFEDVRFVAKSVSHAADYMEGLKVFYPSDLMNSNIKRQITYGCIKLYTDWEYCGGLVGFTGANLALRFFGSKTDENRKKALQIQENVYFKNFPMIRQWHRKILAEIESRGYVQSPTGRFLRLYGSPEDNAKMGTAFYGQGVGADHIEAVMIRYYREMGIIPALTVHDSLLFEIPKIWTDKKANDFIQVMYQESGIRLPKFKVPGKAKRGENYGSLRKLII